MSEPVCAFPPGIPTVKVTGHYKSVSGAGVKGFVTFCAPPNVTLAGKKLFVSCFTRIKLDACGEFSVNLIPTDLDGMNPADWTYKVTENVCGQCRSYAIKLPKNVTEIDLAEIAPVKPYEGNYILLPGPPGPVGPAGAPGATGPRGPAGDSLQSVNTVVASGPSQVLPDPAVASVNDIVLTANCTLVFPAPVAGASFTVALHQDSTGNRSVVWPTATRWPSGMTPAVTATPNAVDVLVFRCTSATAGWMGFTLGKDMKTAGRPNGSHLLP